MKKFKRNKKVFVVYFEDVVRGAIIERAAGGIVWVKLPNGEIESYLPKEIFSMRKDAEREAEKIRAEHIQLMNEAREEAAQAYYADIMEQLPSLI